MGSCGFHAWRPAVLISPGKSLDILLNRRLRGILLPVAIAPGSGPAGPVASVSSSRPVVLNWGSLVSPRGHVVMSGDIWGRDMEELATGI